MPHAPPTAPPTDRRPATTTVHRSLDLTLRGRVLLLLVGLAVGAAWLTGDTHAQLAAGLLLAPLFVDLVLKARGLDRIRVEVETRRTEAGAPFLENVRLLHGGRSRIFHELCVSEPRTSVHHGAAMVESLAPGQEVSVRFSCRSRSRSHLVERSFLLETSYPLGFLQRRIVQKIPADLVTEPARVRLPVHLLRSAQQGDPDYRDNLRQSGGEFHSLREYSHGEDARMVHALRSAATGTLVRRVTQGQQPRQVGLVLDLRRPPGRPLHRGQRRFEWSLGACATLVDHLRLRQMVLSCLVLGEDSRHEELASVLQTVDFLTFLSEALPSHHQPAGDELLTRLEDCESCYWIPAGGFLAKDEIASLRAQVTLVGMSGGAP